MYRTKDKEYSPLVKRQPKSGVLRRNALVRTRVFCARCKILSSLRNQATCSWKWAVLARGSFYSQRIAS
jgi:hypothetical protein